MSEKSIDIVIKARDEASAAFKSAEGSSKSFGGSMSHLVARWGPVYLAVKAGELAFKGYTAATAEAAVAQARAAGDAGGMLEAQIKCNEAWREVAQVVPIAGGAISALMKIFQDDEGIKKQIQDLKDWKQATEDVRKIVDAGRPKAAENAAILRGESPAEATGARQAEEARQRQEDVNKRLFALDQLGASIRGMNRDAKDPVRNTAMVEYAKQYQQITFLQAENRIQERKDAMDRQKMAQDAATAEIKARASEYDRLDAEEEARKKKAADVQEAELAAIEKKYRGAWLLAQKDSDERAKLQDAENAERAAVILRQSARVGGAPLLESRFLTRAPGQDLASESLVVQKKIAKTLETMQQIAERAQGTAGPTVTISDGSQ